TISNDRPQPNSFSIRTRHHHFQRTGRYAQHVIRFCTTFDHSVTYLFDHTNTVVRIHYLVTYFIVHGRRSPQKGRSRYSDSSRAKKMKSSIFRVESASYVLVAA